MSNKTDLATSNVKVSPGTSGTALTLKSGEGQRFPSSDFYATAYPDREVPTKDNAEIVHITSRSDDVLNIERAQYGTTAKNIAAGWRITLSVYAQDFEDIDERLDALDEATGGLPTELQDITDDISALQSLKEDKSNKGIANGYAPLDASSLLPAVNTRVYNDRGYLTASTTYNRWDIVTYRGRKILVTQTSSSGSGANPFFSGSNYVSLGPENIIYAYDYGYRADGNQATAAANTTALQNAVNIAALLQARVVVPPGFGYITAPGIELKDKVVIEGAGAYASIIALANTSNCHMIYNHVSTNGTSDANAQWCGIMNLGLDGRKTFQTGSGPYYGIYFNTNPVSTKATADSNFDPSHIVFNVHVRNAHDDGVYINGRSDIRLIGVKVSFAGGNGFRLSFDTHADHCIAEVSARAGFVLNNSSTQMTGCKSYLSGTGTDAAGVSYPQAGFGYLIDGGVGGAYLGEISISGCDSQQDTAGGIKLINVQGSTVSAFAIAENSYTNATLYPAVTIDKSLYNNVEVANRLTDNVNALLLTNGSNYNNVTIANAPIPGKTPGAQLASGNANLSNYVRINGAQLSPILSSTDVGLGNVDNTSDLSKPISTATQTALNTKESTIASGTTAQYWRGDKTWVTLDKTAVGLANIDNTSDVNKPISTATQAALDLKLSYKAAIAATGSLDLNTYTSNGFYMFTTGAALTNAPNANGYLVVISGNTGGTSTQSDSIKQVWYRMGTNGTNDMNTYVRTRNGGSWGAWTQYAVLSDITAASTTDRDRANHTGTQLASTISDFSSAARSLLSGTTNRVTYDSSTGIISLPQDIHTSATPTFASALITGSIQYGTTQQAALGFSSGKTRNSIILGTDTTTKNIVIIDQANTAEDYSPPVSTNPSLIIYSVRPVSTGPTSYFRLYHDGFNAVLASGTGAITTINGFITNQIQPNTNVARNNGTTAAYWLNTYTQNLFFNSTASLSGSVAGVIAISDATNISAGTTTGTKIGTATSQKIAFYNATPIVQPSATSAAATDLATAITLVNDLRSKLLSLGLVG